MCLLAYQVTLCDSRRVLFVAANGQIWKAADTLVNRDAVAVSDAEWPTNVQWSLAAKLGSAGLLQQFRIQIGRTCEWPTQAGKRHRRCRTVPGEHALQHADDVTVEDVRAVGEFLLPRLEDAVRVHSPDTEEHRTARRYRTI